MMRIPQEVEEDPILDALSARIEAITMENQRILDINNKLHSQLQTITDTVLESEGQADILSQQVRSSKSFTSHLKTLSIRSEYFEAQLALLESARHWDYIQSKKQEDPIASNSKRTQEIELNWLATQIALEKLRLEYKHLKLLSSYKNGFNSETNKTQNWTDSFASPSTQDTVFFEKLIDQQVKVEIENINLRRKLELAEREARLVKRQIKYRHTSGRYNEIGQRQHLRGISNDIKESIRNEDSVYSTDISTLFDVSMTTSEDTDTSISDITLPYDLQQAISKSHHESTRSQAYNTLCSTIDEQHESTSWNSPIESEIPQKSTLLPSPEIAYKKLRIRPNQTVLYDADNQSSPLTSATSAKSTKSHCISPYEDNSQRRSLRNSWFLHNFHTRSNSCDSIFSDNKVNGTPSTCISSLSPRDTRRISERKGSIGNKRLRPEESITPRIVSPLPFNLNVQSARDYRRKHHSNSTTSLSRTMSSQTRLNSGFQNSNYVNTNPMYNNSMNNYPRKRSSLSKKNSTTSISPARATPSMTFSMLQPPHVLKPILSSDTAEETVHGSTQNIQWEILHTRLEYLSKTYSAPLSKSSSSKDSQKPMNRPVMLKQVSQFALLEALSSNDLNSRFIKDYQENKKASILLKKREEIKKREEVQALDIPIDSLQEAIHSECFTRESLETINFSSNKRKMSSKVKECGSNQNKSSNSKQTPSRNRSKTFSIFTQPPVSSVPIIRINSDKIFGDETDDKKLESQSTHLKLDFPFLYPQISSDTLYESLNCNMTFGPNSLF